VSQDGVVLAGLREATEPEDGVNVELAVLVDYATTTADGKLIIAGVFDVISVASFPAWHPGRPICAINPPPGRHKTIFGVASTGRTQCGLL